MELVDPVLFVTKSVDEVMSNLFFAVCVTSMLNFQVSKNKSYQSEQVTKRKKQNELHLVLPPSPSISWPLVTESDWY